MKRAKIMDDFVGEQAVATIQAIFGMGLAGDACKPKPNRYKIIIESDGHTTTGAMTINGKEIKTSKARLHPSDQFDWKIGARFAFERLWNRPPKPAKETKKPTVREVKRHAIRGEYVQIVHAMGCFTEQYRNGDILRVIFVDEDGWVRLECGGTAAGPEEYVVLEGYRP